MLSKRFTYIDAPLKIICITTDHIHFLASRPTFGGEAKPYIIFPKLEQSIPTSAPEIWLDPPTPCFPIPSHLARWQSLPFF